MESVRSAPHPVLRTTFSPREKGNDLPPLLWGEGGRRPGEGSSMAHRFRLSLKDSKYQLLLTEPARYWAASSGAGVVKRAIRPGHADCKSGSRLLAAALAQASSCCFFLAAASAFAEASGLVGICASTMVATACPDPGSGNAAIGGGITKPWRSFSAGSLWLPPSEPRTAEASGLLISTPSEQPATPAQASPQATIDRAMPILNIIGPAP